MSAPETIHRYVAGDSGATLLLLHGTGGDENDLVSLGRELAPRANLLSPRGAVSEQGLPRFFRRLALGVFDEDDLVRRAADLASFVAASAARYGFDPGRVFALGYSNGANIAAALMLLHPNSLAGGVLLRPVLPLEPPTLPALAGVSVLLAAGRDDPYAPHERVEALAERLRAGGAEVELAWRAAGHSLVPSDLEHAGAWLSARLDAGADRDRARPGG